MLRIDGELRYRALPVGTSKTEALRTLRSLKVGRDDRLAPLPKSMRLVDVAASAFDAMDGKVASGKMSARTVALYEQRWRTHLEPRLGRRKLADITKGAVITFAADLQKNDRMSEATAHGVLVVLRAILRHARLIDAITFNPFAGIDAGALPSPSASRREQRVLREHEIWRLLDKTLPNYRPIVTLLCWSGLRVSEGIALRWQDVSFVDDCFRVQGQLAPTRRGETPTIVKPKSRRGARQVPFLPVVRDALIELLATQQHAGRGGDDDFVFATRSGRPFTRQNISERAIAKAAKRAGLGEDIRAHVLRRSFCTFVADDPSIPPSEAAALTGHDERVWWTHYVQPRRDAQARREIVAKLTARGLGVRPQVDQEVDHRP
jgi:integrase